ncbi:MAG: DUF1707 SHOCT-like domain-containing protein [Streptosporangiaceae bacterium]
MASDGGMRASDSDREKVVEVLGSAYTEGRLSLDEFDDRTTAAYAAKTWGELRTLTGDLPVGVSLDVQSPATQPDLSLTPPAGPGGPQHGVVFFPVLPVAIAFLILASSTHVVLLFLPMIILLVTWRATRPSRGSGRRPHGRYPDHRSGGV